MTAAMNRSDMINEENLKIAFQAFDRAGDGKITAEELKFVIGDKDACDTTWPELIMAFDTDKDGAINFDDFMKMMSQFSDNT